ncbi:hypothetical protein BDQ12DRAFT_619677, partial [Crucibulum laeve]
QIYVEQMIPSRMGYPLWTPSPSASLPLTYQMKGISVGDIGIITTPHGGFDYIFNIWLDSANFNGQIPPKITEKYPYFCNQFHAISRGSIIGNINKTTGKTSFTCKRDIPGAILFLPDGASHENFQDDLTDYISQHAESWFLHVKTAKQRNINQKSLYLITGCTKTKTWGIVSYHENDSADKVTLKFKKVSCSDGPQYTWQENGAIAGLST